MCSPIPGRRPIWRPTLQLPSPGDTVLGMDLAHGGHLTHGAKVSFSGQLYRFVHYGVDRETGTIDYAVRSAAWPSEHHRPK
jgi:glycine hydroxymethyltransferase